MQTKSVILNGQDTGVCSSTTDYMLLPSGDSALAKALLGHTAKF